MKLSCSSFRCNWICSSVASATSVSSSQGDISYIAPSCSPRVLSDDVVIFIEANTYNTMIKSVTTVTENTSTVELPIFSINTDGDWLSGEGLYEGSTVTRCNVYVATDGELNFSFYIAILIHGNIWICIFCLNSVFNDVFEGIVH